MNATSAQSIGEFLGVEYLITGSLELTGVGYRLLFNAVDTERAELQAQYIAVLNLRNDQQLTLLLGAITSSQSREQAQGNTQRETREERENRERERRERERIEREEREQEERERREREREEKAKADAERREQQRVERERKKQERQALAPVHLNSLGVSMGTSLSAPMFIASLFGTYAPAGNSFFEAGVDAGFGSSDSVLENHSSLYPHLRYNFLVPFSAKNGWYIGAGGGYMYASYSIPGIGETSDGFFILDLSTGFIFNFFTVSYSVRTDFSAVNSKFTLGYLYRFKDKGE